VDALLLPDRDENDRKVSLIVRRIRATLRDLFKPYLVIVGSPLRYALTKELDAFKRLTDVIRSSVDEFLNYIDGDYPMPLKCEMLWLKI
jgi:hypothetical protein